MKSFGEGKIRTGRSGEGKKKWGPLSSEKSFLPSPIFPLISKTTCAMPTKQPMPPVPPLQPLLFWETGVLLFVAGIVAARFPVPALTACALFAWTDSRTRRPLCCLLAAGVRHRRLVDRRKVRSPRPPRVPGMAGKEPVLTAGRHRGRHSRRFARSAGSAAANPFGRRGPGRRRTASRQAGTDMAGHARRTSSLTGATDNRKPENPPGSRFPQPRRVEQ